MTALQFTDVYVLKFRLFIKLILNSNFSSAEALLAYFYNLFWNDQQNINMLLGFTDYQK